MSFIDAVAASPEWRDACEEREQAPDLTSLAPYVVDDIRVECAEAGQVILLLESPHTLETCRGFPLAGPSGLAVATHLRSTLRIPGDVPNCPIGDVLRNHRCNDHLRKTGVMNVSQLPMQSTAYLCEARAEFDELLFRRLKHHLQQSEGRETNRPLDQKKSSACWSSV